MSKPVTLYIECNIERKRYYIHLLRAHNKVNNTNLNLSDFLLEQLPPVPAEWAAGGKIDHEND